MPDLEQDMKFIMAMVKGGSLSIDYEAASKILGDGWDKRKCQKFMCEFRKRYDYPIKQDAPTAAKGTKRAATKEDSEGEGGGDAVAEVKKPTKKRAKGKKAVKEEVAEDEDEVMEA